MAIQTAEPITSLDALLPFESIIDLRHVGRPTAAPLAPRHRTSLMGVPVDVVTERGAIDEMLAAAGIGSGGSVVTPNVDILRQIVRNPELRSAVAEASFMLVDGAPLVWASRLQGDPVPERIPGATFIWSLSRAAAQAGAPVFLLGGAPGVAQRAGQVLGESIPGLNVCGDYCPPYGFEDSPADIEAICAAIEMARPTFVFCGLGCPKQERLMAALRQQFPGVWFLASGGSLDFVAGATRRAPEWIQRAGLEWLHRLAHEPKRLFRRYIINDIPFAIQLLVHAAGERRRDRSAPLSAAA